MISRYIRISLAAITIGVLSSCSETPEYTQKHYTTYITKGGNILIQDTLQSNVEGDNSSDLGFRTAGIVGEILVSPGESVKKGQLLAVLGNRESAIQVGSLREIEGELKNLKNTTQNIRSGTEEIGSATENLYDERIRSLDTQIQSAENNLKKAKQNLSNQTDSLTKTLRTYATDVDRISTSMLYEGDRILGISTNFEYSNDAWEPYLGTRIGNAKSEAENRWNALYAQRGVVRSYIEKIDAGADTTEILEGLNKAYLDMRALVTSMNTMLHNSVVGGGLEQERLDGWLKQWSGFGGEAQLSESGYIAWKNASAGLIQSGEDMSTTAEKDLISLELDIESMRQSRAMLQAEKQAKLKEIQTNIATIESKKGEVSLQIAQTRMNTALASEGSEYNIIRAPYDGIILTKYSEVGVVVGAGAPILRITSKNARIAKVYIDNTLYGYKKSDAIQYVRDDEKGVTYTGTIKLIQGQKDPLYNKNYAEIELENSRIIGEKIRIQLYRKKDTTENGILIPLRSIITRFGPPGVYVLRDGRAVFQHIEILASDMGYAEVQGLSEGVEVIVEGKENIYDGELVGKLIPSGE